jgi:hypothetical protein
VNTGVVDLNLGYNKFSPEAGLAMAKAIEVGLLE